MDGAGHVPPAELRPYVGDYVGYELVGFAAGTHLGLPAPTLTVIVTFEPDVVISRAVLPAQSGTAYETLASGITTGSVTIAHDGTQRGVQLEFTPLGARALFGLPPAELGSWLVDLGDVLGRDAVELRERAAERATWPERFAVVDDILLRRLRALGEHTAPDRSLRHAWHRLVSDGNARVGAVAAEIGWSRRRLAAAFGAEFGVTPKDAGRLGRFARSHRMLKATGVPDLADVAVQCGFYDQAHMTREWNAFAGTTPARWRRDEVFPIVQYDETDGDAQ
ncbi:AraC family transcriptional regulator [Rhodococcus sp. HNM0569]|nr:AraC family transcriptional regulator [Rhodococcus sp. HNM0569]